MIERKTRENSYVNPGRLPPASSCPPPVYAGPIHSKVIGNPIGFPGSRQFSSNTANIL